MGRVAVLKQVRQIFQKGEDKDYGNQGSPGSGFAARGWENPRRKK